MEVAEIINIFYKYSSKYLSKLKYFKISPYFLLVQFRVVCKTFLRINRIYFSRENYNYESRNWRSVPSVFERTLRIMRFVETNLYSTDDKPQCC